MRTITLLGGTSWPSTIEYYRYLNETIAAKLGGFHSAKIILHSIDYHEIKSSYSGGWERIPGLLADEIRGCMTAGAQCLIICNNTLHKAFDSIEQELALTIPVFHAVRLTADEAVKRGNKRLLLLATKFTMEDGFFRDAITQRGIEVIIPTLQERDEVQAIQTQLAAGKLTPEFADYFANLTERYKTLDGVILACTELPLAVTKKNCALAILDPVKLQSDAAIHWALG